jgi:hypothetical protein
MTSNEFLFGSRENVDSVRSSSALATKREGVMGEERTAVAFASSHLRNSLRGSARGSAFMLRPLLA